MKMNKLLLSIILLLTISSVSGALIDGQSAYYNGSLDASNIFDMASDNNGGVNSGVTVNLTGKIGQGFAFDGSDYVDMTSQNFYPSANTAFSYNLWVFPTKVSCESPDGRCDVISMRDQRKGILTIGDPDPGDWGLWTGSFTTTGDTAIINTWTMMTVVYNTTTPQYDVYKDGSHTLTVGVTDSSEGKDFSIGVADNLAAAFFTGVMDEIGFWNKTLSAGEVSQLYAGGDGLQYPFTTITLTSYFDLSVTGVSVFNATINGTFQSTTNGTINTALNQTKGGLVNITINADNYFSTTYTNYNVSTDLTLSLNKYPEIQGRNLVNNSLITGFGVIVNGSIFYYDLDIDGSVFLPIVALTNLTFTASNYLNNVQEFNLEFNGTYNFTGYQSIISFETFKKYLFETIYNFSVSGGGLSNTTTTGVSVLKLNADDNITISFTNDLGYYNETFDISVNATDIETYNISAYNHKLNFTPRDYFSNVSLSNFTLTINNSGVRDTYVVGGDSIILNLTNSLNYTLYVNVTDYAPKTNVTTIDNTSASSYNMYFFRENSIYIRVFDEQTGLLINDRNVSVEFISDGFATENTTSTGALIVYPLIQGDYRVRYGANEYPERLYFISVTGGETQAIDVYSLKGSSGTNITCAVYDEKGDPVQGSYLKLLKYYLSCNCYKTVEIGETAFDGTTGLLVEFNSELYKILIDYNGKNYLQTTPFKITSTILNFYITLEDLDPTGELRKFQDLVYDLSYDELTDTFTFTYSDVNNHLARGCLEIFQTSLSSETSLNRTCVNSTGATINLVRPVLNGSSYKAKAEVYYGDVRILAEQLLVSKNTGLATIGNGATLLIIFLILTFSLISLWNANVSIVMVLIALIFASMLDLLTIGGTALMGIIGAGIIIVIQNKS